MKALALLILLCLAGCATVDQAYYTNPNSPGYAECVFSGICEKCYRVFNLSGQQYDTVENIQCPYCGTVQNLRMAYNRYTYQKQQEENEESKIRTQNMWKAYSDYTNREAERAKEYNTNMQNYYLQQMNKHSTTKCRQMWDGSIQCDTY